MVLELPGMDECRVFRDLTYKDTGDVRLTMDVYHPPGHRAGTALPVVIFVPGDGPPDVIAGAKDWGQYVSWGRLAAVSGLAAVTSSHRSTEAFTRLPEAAEDVDDLVSHVRASAASLDIDPDRLAIWTCSAGPPFALRTAVRDRPPFLRCLVALYGLMDLRHLRDQLSPSIPDDVLAAHSPVELLGRSAHGLPSMLVVRAGKDEPEFNHSIDAFVKRALSMNAPVDAMTHPQGHHAFDVVDDDQWSRKLIRRILAFLQSHILR